MQRLVVSDGVALAADHGCIAQFPEFATGHFAPTAVRIQLQISAPVTDSSHILAQPLAQQRRVVMRVGVLGRELEREIALHLGGGEIAGADVLDAERSGLERTLMRNGLLYRFPQDQSYDGLSSPENAFGPCSFWAAPKGASAACFREKSTKRSFRTGSVPRHGTTA